MNPSTLFSLLLISLIFSQLIAIAQPEPIAATTTVPVHPRLLLLQGQEAAIKQTIGKDAAWEQIHQAILTECDEMLTLPLLQRTMIGRRLLDVSRESIRREFFLAYAWRMTRQGKYRQRAEQELLAIAAFSDWNPSHFLDVAEMTTGVALGYDWLYQDLSKASRATIREAILHKGLEPSLDPKSNDWLTSTNNWNQVCNTGMAFGALAIYEDQPELARKLLNRAVTTVVTSMRHAYSPDGAYPEGSMYWGYGTSFNILLISALDRAFGQNFGLVQQPGFLKTASYQQNMVGPTGKAFNFSDSVENSEMSLSPPMFWFADQLRMPSLLWGARAQLQAPDRDLLVKNRLLPALLLWSGGIAIKDIPAPAPTPWVGTGATPVALMRTSWTDPAAIYVGFKGGSPSTSHGHMDVGSFVLDADGVRWAMDFGMQQYESLESKGVDLWGKQRWDVYRYTNHVHNTLTINDALQEATAFAPLTGTSAESDFLSATADLSKLYTGPLTAARRGIAIVDRRYVVVRDELTAGSTQSTVRWTMLTPATVKLLNATTAELTQGGKKLRLQVAEPAAITLKTWPTTPPHEYDAPNPGTTLLGFEVTLPANAKHALTVVLLPASAGPKPAHKVQPLAQWPQQAVGAAGQ
ncbi:heparinase II/III domain-containing protein [Hymenobacter terrenus]|uniref:heparinase II/III domain-containing protein n=1 Tax=Hymenobacter terrenus TaxID=1629124 RepID=UPI0006198B92|nr:heparinase II/III family protein [Hymenobacter terrenus]